MELFSMPSTRWKPFILYLTPSHSELYSQFLTTNISIFGVTHSFLFINEKVAEYIP